MINIANASRITFFKTREAAAKIAAANQTDDPERAQPRPLGGARVVGATRNHAASNQED